MSEIIDVENVDAVAVVDETKSIAQKNNTGCLLLDQDYVDRLQRAANILKGSNLIPEHYQKLEDCAVAIHMAASSGIDPLFLLQNTQVVRGKPGWTGQAIIALLNQCKRYTKPLDFDFVRDEQGKVISCTCFTFDQDGNRKEAAVSWAMVVDEGWDKPKKSMKSKWVTMPEQMFCYRSAAFLARRFSPDILYGLQTEDELRDVNGDPEKTIGKTSKANALNEMAEKSEIKDVTPVDENGDVNIFEGLGDGK